MGFKFKGITLALGGLVSALLLQACGSPWGQGEAEAEAKPQSGAESSHSAQFHLSEAQFDQLFPQRLAFYRYEEFIAAQRSMPGFAGTGSELLRRQEMAAFLAQIGHESDELKAQREYRVENHDKYCREQEPGERCAPGQQYYGRGPIQLSWNYQYKKAGEALGLDLWADPDRVARDAKVAWQTALWYWMTQPGPNIRSAHAAFVNGGGFGETTRSINGVLECDKPADANVQRLLQRRIDLYLRASAVLGVPPSESLRC
ncbi:chitinase [Paucibacter sp. KBW04]|uniref:chitinase n=1 Tax=Paucibacter sp. KBW04 TaxID=2153361 RepID=UPI000F56C756|nr:chitinase [Paucibacter sp. KBW04]RQO61147.1 chitinase [Paucibacter sp. KBW04]